MNFKKAFYRYHDVKIKYSSEVDTSFPFFLYGWDSFYDKKYSKYHLKVFMFDLFFPVWKTSNDFEDITGFIFIMRLTSSKRSIFVEGILFLGQKDTLKAHS